MTAPNNFSWKRKARLFLGLLKESGPSAALAWGRDTLRGSTAPIPVTIRGVDVLIRPSTTDAAVVLASLRGEFDDLFKAVPEARHGLIIDGGGYIGTAAIVFAKAYPDATVVTLEPSPDNYQLLLRNTAKYDNIRPMNAALAPEEGSISLRDRGTGHWGHTIVSDPADAKTSVLAEVPAVTIDRLLELNDKAAIDVLKLDIEGGEHQLLLRGEEWVDKIEAICIELHDRIVPGCTQAYEAATNGRNNSKLPGEKYLSVAA